ncbi:hypothetical protein [Lysobacter gummosus]|uniref:hypothetical protein n=1 Tax=Lysobacter gummosus TaxID=262324 RepID=UPI00363FE39F
MSSRTAASKALRRRRPVGAGAASAGFVLPGRVCSVKASGGVLPARQSRCGHAHTRPSRSIDDGDGEWMDPVPIGRRTAKTARPRTTGPCSA